MKRFLSILLIYVTVIFPFLFSSLLFSQITGQLMEKSLNPKIPFTIIQYGTKHGLPQNQVMSIIAKRNGTLILSTSNGIVELNGYTFKSIIENDSYKKFSFYKLHYYEDKNLLLGIDRHNGLYTLIPEFKRIDVNQEQIRSVASKNDSLIAISTKGNIYFIDLKKLKSKFITSVPAINPAYFELKPVTLQLKTGKLYIAAQEGLFVLDLVSLRTQKISGDFFTCLQVNPYNNKLYAATPNKVFRFDDYKAAEVLNTKSDGNTRFCQDIVFTDTNSMYVATTYGLYTINSGRIQFYNKEHGLPSVLLHSLYFDKTSRCLFVGSGLKGLFKLQFKSDYSYGLAGLSEYSVSSIIQTYSGKILMSEVFCNIYEIRKDSILNYNKFSVNFLWFMSDIN